MKDHPEILLFQSTYPELIGLTDQVISVCRIMIDCFHRGGKLLVCGNGGSASDAEHITGELMKGFKQKRPIQSELRQKLESLYPDGAVLADRLQRAFPSIPLCSQSALMTAVLNDISGDMVYAQQVFGYGKPEDVLIVLSTSGKSPNIVAAAKTGKAMGLKVIGITGQNPSPLADVVDICFHIPATETSRVQELTIPIYHCFCAVVEAELFNS